ncbi:MAG: hypothetical protein KAU23_03835 [Anaerolineales bacterium]|nr:hypothetical protein [Anaerolineales bacterium]
MVNRRLLFIGAVVALIFGGAIFALSFMTGAEPPVEILAARQDISEGTLVRNIPDDLFARIPLTGDQILLSSYLTETVWQQIKAAGGIVIRDIYQYEAIPLSAIASDGNPKVVDIPRLGLTDPNLVVVSLTNVSVPNGIKVGDYVDLIVAVESAQEQVFTLVQTQNFETLTEAAAEVVVEEGAAPSAIATATPTPEPTPEPTPVFEPGYPLAKVIVMSARVADVQREQTISASGDRLVLGEVTGIDVVIPRVAQEFVLMADTAGNLGASMLSPMVDAETDGGPTLGAHFDDLLDLFAADRNALKESE